MTLHNEQEIMQQPQTTYLHDYAPPVFLIDEVHLTFDLHEDHAQVKSHMRVRHNRMSDSKSRDLLLNGDELELVSIRVDGKELTENQYSVGDNTLCIFDMPDTFALDIETRIFPQKNTALSGLYRSNNKFCTQCEAEGFRRITYFPDRPDVLARYTVTINADKKLYPCLLSNGNMIDVGDLENGRHFAKWEDPFNKPCYLFALVAGDFDVLEDSFTTQSDRQVALKFYVEKGQADMAKHAMFSLKQAMRWDEINYGREYDLDIYMIVAVSDFNMGAMENKGLNVFNSKYVLANPQTASDRDYMHISSVIAHEYFHNWTGNRVTCRDWFQLSLKEGLTIFRDQSFSQDLLSRGVMRIHDVNMLRERQFPEDEGPLAHPVRPTSYVEINNFYTVTIYEKGAEVLRMMQTLLGKDVFRKGMDLYFAQHDGQAVTIEDFVRNMEDVSGVDLTQFKLWYSQAGTPLVTVRDNYDAAAKRYTLTITQYTPPTPGHAEKLPLHIPVSVALLDENGKEMHTSVLHLTEPEQTFEFNNIASKPVPSLLRHFSAPVKLQYDYKDEDLLFLSRHDQDAFNNWEAGQKYILRVLLQLIKDYQQRLTLKLPAELVEMFRHMLDPGFRRNDTGVVPAKAGIQGIPDYFLLAEKLSVPTENYIGEQMDVVDVDAIHATREFMLSDLARQLESSFLSLYQRCSQDNKQQFDIKTIGQRQLKNTCLSYLGYLPQQHELVAKQFHNALGSNMTDAQAALAILANIPGQHRETALQAFYDKWHADALVVDKWLAIQAAAQLPDALDKVKALAKHKAFDIKNPNKVYALIGTLGARNASAFHAKNGEGYVYLREIVQQLDTLNPQIAARMVNPLTTWRRYDKDRQTLMRAQLEILQKSSKLSPDLYEMVTKSLG